MKIQTKSLFLLSFLVVGSINSAEVTRGFKKLGSGTVDVITGSVKKFWESEGKVKKTIIAGTALGLAGYKRAFLWNKAIATKNYIKEFGTYTKLLGTAGIGAAGIAYRIYSKKRAIDTLKEIEESYDNKVVRASDRNKAKEISKKWHFWGWRKDSDEDKRVFKNGFVVDEYKNKPANVNEVLKCLVGDAKIDGKLYLLSSGNSIVRPVFEKDKPDVLTQDTLRVIQDQMESELEKLEEMQDTLNDLVGSNCTDVFEEELLEVCKGQPEDDGYIGDVFQGKTSVSAMRFFHEEKLRRLKDAFTGKFDDDKIRSKIDGGIVSYLPGVADWISGSKLLSWYMEDDANCKGICKRAASAYFETQKLYGRLKAIREIVSVQIKPLSGDQKKDNKKDENFVLKAKENCEKVLKKIKETRDLRAKFRTDFDALNKVVKKSTSSLMILTEEPRADHLQSIIEAYDRVKAIGEDLSIIIKLNNKFNQYIEDEDDEHYRRKQDKKERKVFEEDDSLKEDLDRLAAWQGSMEYIIKGLDEALNDSKPAPGAPAPAPAPKGDGHNPLRDSGKKSADEKEEKEKKELDETILV